jgi:hypothetical protein
LGVYKLPIPYNQPVLRLSDIDGAAQHPIPEWLLYAPREGSTLEKVGNRYFMPREVVIHLLESLFLYNYADTFSGSAEYQTYIRAEYAKHIATLPERLELIQNPRLA